MDASARERPTVQISAVRCLGMRLEGHTRRPRHAAVFEVKESILNNGGAITDYQLFSNRVLRLSIEVPSARMAELIAGIEATGVDLVETTVRDAVSEAQRSEARLVGTLAIRFLADEPDLRGFVPPIPG